MTVPLHLHRLSSTSARVAPVPTPGAPLMQDRPDPGSSANVDV
jgi:hypothetical protein